MRVEVVAEADGRREIRMPDRLDNQHQIALATPRTSPMLILSRVFRETCRIDSRELLTDRGRGPVTQLP